MSGRNRSAARGATGAAGADVDQLVTALLTASRALVAVSARSLAELEETVTIPQFRALVVLGRHERINLNGLAEELGVTASTAMRMVDRLLTAGLVTREENPTNRREVVLALSAEGAARVATVTRRRRAGIAAIVRAMPAERRSELVEALHAFADAAGEPSARISELGW
ncbi:MarR family winged helix-turn-helix transcriptional regulator [uncultured Jatrophihabitans sp.]|uniref:MarR family winged helix-turn-helix transcriptional regulator n=1 Tax=uncultured Jatrophihabitans sp. TaxID=1610747 RepID=UPI0035C9FDCE